MAASSRPGRRRRVERGIYEQPNGSFAVCVMVDGQPRFRTLKAATIGEAQWQRELLQGVACSASCRSRRGSLCRGCGALGRRFRS
jgi:hypothetical protein